MIFSLTFLLSYSDTNKHKHTLSHSHTHKYRHTNTDIQHTCTNTYLFTEGLQEVFATSVFEIKSGNNKIIVYSLPSSIINSFSVCMLAYGALARVFV